MKIVIDIDEATYDDLMNGLLWHDTLYKEDIIATLPKGHDRLIDADKYKREYVDWIDSCYGHTCSKEWKESIDDAPTIIEADTESEVEK